MMMMLKPDIYSTPSCTLAGDLHSCIWRWHGKRHKEECQSINRSAGASVGMGMRLFTQLGEMSRPVTLPLNGWGTKQSNVKYAVVGTLDRVR